VQVEDDRMVQIKSSCIKNFNVQFCFGQLEISEGTHRQINLNSHCDLVIRIMSRKLFVNKVIYRPEKYFLLVISRLRTERDIRDSRSASSRYLIQKIDGYMETQIYFVVYKSLVNAF
jgi:hypothetical protein